MPLYKPKLHWLEQCIHSLLSQTETEWQLIVSLDGQDNETIKGLKLIESIMKDRNRMLIARGEKRGIAVALNRGIHLCNTEYIARMDADDICMPNRFKVQKQILDKNKQIVAVGTQIELINEYGRKIERKTAYPIDYKGLLICAIAVNNPIAHPTLMTRTNAIQKIRGYREMQCMEDYDLIARLVNVGIIENIRMVGLKYRIHGKQTTALTRPNRKDLLLTRLRFAKEMAKKDPIAIAITIVPCLYFLIGPKKEYQLRSLAKKILEFGTN